MKLSKLANKLFNVGRTRVKRSNGQTQGLPTRIRHFLTMHALAPI
jgi:hypothetical protein